MEEKCTYCNDLNEEREEMQVDEVYIRTDGYFHYDCPIKYCPACGKILDKYKDEEVK